MLEQGRFQQTDPHGASAGALPTAEPYTTGENVVHENAHELEIINAGGIIPNVFSGTVNSLHHQGVVKCGEGLSPSTYWKGVYESTENEDILTVQFHPEWMDDHENALGMNLWEVLSTWAGLGEEIREGVLKNAA